MKLFKMGHYTDLEKGTGCTVILCPEGTKASAHARGAAPGTREYALLSPSRKVEEIYALFFSGGSAFGLDATAGVMQYLRERNIGYFTPFGKIPIVPAAVIYDLYTVDSQWYPRTENGYQACVAAKTDFHLQGNVGAGTGATVGKWAGLENMMKGGLGIARIEFDQIIVSVIAVVNPVGDVVNSDGTILAGARRNKRFLAADNPEIRWHPPEVGFGENTVLVAVLTNTKFSKLQLNYLAERSHNGIVKAVVPAHTQFDGDIVFAMGTQEVPAELEVVTEMAIEGVRQAILNSVKEAEPLGGVAAIQSPAM